jgi:hypothetical protein
MGNRITKKHFDALADIVQGEANLTLHIAMTKGMNDPTYLARRDLLVSLTDALVDFCYDYNSDFDSERFREACAAEQVREFEND